MEEVKVTDDDDRGIGCCGLILSRQMDLLQFHESNDWPHRRYATDHLNRVDEPAAAQFSCDSSLVVSLIDRFNTRRR